MAYTLPTVNSASTSFCTIRYEEIATEDAVPTARVRKAIRYAFLAPDIVRAIVDGRQPVGLTSSYLLHHPLPDDWEKQRTLVATL